MSSVSFMLKNQKTRLFLLFLHHSLFENQVETRLFFHCSKIRRVGGRGAPFLFVFLYFFEKAAEQRRDCFFVLEVDFLF